MSLSERTCPTWDAVAMDPRRGIVSDRSNACWCDQLDRTNWDSLERKTQWLVYFGDPLGATILVPHATRPLVPRGAPSPIPENSHMADPAMRPATYEDLLRVPEHLLAEILNGRLVTHPRPASRHIRASSRLGNKLGPPFDEGSGGPGGWVILDEPELHLGSHVLVPDLAGWKRERMPRLPDG